MWWNSGNFWIVVWKVFFPNSSMRNRWKQTEPKTFQKRRRLVPIYRIKLGSRSLIYRACKLHKFSKKIDYLFLGLRLPHPNFSKKSDINCLKKFVIWSHDFLHNICNYFHLFGSVFFSFCFFLLKCCGWLTLENYPIFLGIFLQSWVSCSFLSPGASIPSFCVVCWFDPCPSYP